MEDAANCRKFWDEVEVRKSTNERVQINSVLLGEAHIHTEVYGSIILKSHFLISSLVIQPQPLLLICLQLQSIDEWLMMKVMICVLGTHNRHRLLKIMKLFFTLVKAPRE